MWGVSPQSVVSVMTAGGATPSVEAASLEGWHLPWALRDLFNPYFLAIAL